MIKAGDFRNGVTLEYKDGIFQVIDFQHVKPGKGSPFVRTKLKNVKTGNVIEDTFSPDDKLPKAHIETKECTFSYDDGSLYHFTDTETWDDIMVPHEIAEESMKFVKDNEVIKIMSCKGEIISVEAPNFVELEITNTEPGFKGNTATGATKPAIVETGAEVKVPLFVNEGDIIRIDTRTGEYMSRA